MKPGNRKTREVVLLCSGLALLAAGFLVNRVPARYEATARIKIQRFRPLTPPGARTAFFPAPHNTSSDLAALASEPVLQQAVSALALDQKWNQRYAASGGLDRTNVLELLRRRVRFAVVPNTTLIDISATDDNPTEAADIANAIADAFQNLREQDSRKSVASLTAELEGRWEEEWTALGKRIQEQQEKLNQLRLELHLPENGAPDNDSDPGKARSFFQIESALDDLKRSRQDLSNNISQQHLVSKIPETTNVQVIDRAAPPTRPASPSRPLETGLFVSGSLFSAAGLALFTVRRKPAAKATGAPQSAG